MEPIYVGIDTETGGVDHTTTDLLTFYAGLFDKNLNYIRGIDMAVQPDNGVFRVTGGAMRVNKINLNAHSKGAVYYSKAQPHLINFLSEATDGGTKKLKLFGQNVGFDQGYTWQHLVPKDVWDVFVSYRVHDTDTLAVELKELGILPANVSTSLNGLCKHFNITNRKAHTAKEDVMATAQVLVQLRRLLVPNWGML